MSALENQTNQNQSITKLILLAMTLLPTTCSEIITGVDTANKTIPKNSILFMVIKLFLYGFAIDFCMISAIFYRGHRNYLSNHKTYFSLFTVSVLILTYFQKSLSSMSSQFSIFLISTFLIQFLIGFWIEKVITSKTNGQKSELKKWFHKYLSFFQLICIKCDLFIMFYENLSKIHAITAALSFSAFTVLVYAYFGLFRNPQIKKPNFPQKFDRTEYRDVLKSLQLN